MNRGLFWLIIISLILVLSIIGWNIYYTLDSNTQNYSYSNNIIQMDSNKLFSNKMLEKIRREEEFNKNFLFVLDQQ
jgi:predicted negative regulator of RcsB-dependent stress response